MNKSKKNEHIGNMAVDGQGKIIGEGDLEEYHNQVEKALIHLGSSHRLLSMLSETDSKYKIDLKVTTKKESAHFISAEAALIKMVLNHIKKSSFECLFKYY